MNKRKYFKIFLGFKCLRPNRCLNKGDFYYVCSYCTSEWDKNFENVEDIHLIPSKWKYIAEKSHVLVDKGIACWIGDTLLTGYTLNNHIWRPIFSEKREKIFQKVRERIPITVRKKIAYSELFKKSNLPIEIIEKIMVCL